MCYSLAHGRGINAGPESCTNPETARSREEGGGNAQETRGCEESSRNTRSEKTREIAADSEKSAALWCKFQKKVRVGRFGPVRLKLIRLCRQGGSPDLRSSCGGPAEVAALELVLLDLLRQFAIPAITTVTVWKFFSPSMCFTLRWSCSMVLFECPRAMRSQR